MAGAGDKGAGRRFGRRSALLVALGLVSSLGAAGALAAISVSSSAVAGTIAGEVETTSSTAALARR